MSDMRCTLSLCLFLTFKSSALFAEDTPETPPLSTAEVHAFIADLGHNDYDKREAAQKALLTLPIGEDALALLLEGAKNSDREISTRALLIYQRRFWNTLPSMPELSTLLAPNTGCVFWTQNLRESTKTFFRQSELGSRLASEPATTILRALFNELCTGDNRDFNKEWMFNYFERLPGAHALGFCGLKNDLYQFFVLAEAASGQQHKAFDFFSRDLFGYEPNEANAERKFERGADFKLDPQTGAAVARLGRTVASSNDSQLLSGLAARWLGVDKNSLAASETFKAAQLHTPPNALARFFAEARLADTVFNDDEPNAKLAQRLGLQHWRYSTAGLYAKDGLLLESVYGAFDGERAGIAKVLSIEPYESAWAARCPKDALAFVSYPIKAHALWDLVNAFIPPEEDNELRKAFLDFNQVHKLEDWLALLDGEASAWALAPQDPTKAPKPSVVLCLSAKSPADAEAFAKKAVEIASAASGIEELALKGEKDGRVYWHLDPEKSKRFGFAYAWAVHGSDVILSADERTLFETLARLDQQPAPEGLSTTADYKHLLGALPVKERGAYLYINAERAAKVYWPCLLASLEDVKLEGKAFIPKDPDAFFKDFPGTLLSTTATQDGLQFSSAGGIPILSSALPYAALMFVFLRNLMDGHRVPL